MEENDEKDERGVRSVVEEELMGSFKEEEAEDDAEVKMLHVLC